MGADPATALTRGIDFLQAGQGRDGLWRDFETPAGLASTWPTGYVGAALRAAGGDPGCLQAAAAALTERQHADGGWGYNETTPSDADATAWAVRFLIDQTGSPGWCEPARRMLVRHQRRSGGVATYAESGPIREFTGSSWWLPFWGWCRPSIEVSATVGCVYGRISPAQADATWRFVRRRQNADGHWDSYWWTSAHFATWQAVELARLVGVHDCVDRAAAWTRGGQRTDGSWSTPAIHPSARGDSTPGPPTSCFATGLALSIITAAGADDPDNCQAIERAVEALAQTQADDGGWPSRPNLRIPIPVDASRSDQHRWRPVRFNAGLVVADQHRTFTTATCIAALAGALQPPSEPA